MSVDPTRPLSTLTHGPFIITRYRRDRLEVSRTTGEQVTIEEARTEARWFWRCAAIAGNDPTD